MNYKNPFKSQMHSKINFKELIGNLPQGSNDVTRARLHQAWWRLNVLCEPEGDHPIRTDKTVCNTMSNGFETGNNFVTENTWHIVKQTLATRKEDAVGKIEENRLYNNLLSSQPLCFNFFAELTIDKGFGLQVLKNWWPEITELNEVLFEFSPKENYTQDGSAFDVAFDVQFGNKRGFIGLECKYTDTFSYKPQKSNSAFYGDKGNKNYETYIKLFNKCQSAFKRPYFDYVRSKNYNQLFRNQLMAEAMCHFNDYDIVKTGLFCFEKDLQAIATGNEFQSMLTNGTDKFTVITYADFIEKTQQLNLTWYQREWTMLLWARYCGFQLSDEVSKQF